MRDQDKTEKQLLDEIGVLRQQVAALQITNTQRETEWRQKTIFVELLKLVAIASQEEADFERIVQRCVADICRQLNWSVGHVYRVAEDNELIPTDIWYLAQPERFQAFRAITERTRCAPGQGLPGQVMAQRQPAWITSVPQGPESPRTKCGIESGIKAGIAFPVVAGDDVILVLEFFSTEFIAPDEQLLDILSHLGTQLGRLSERKKAEEMLRQSEERYRTIIEEMADGFWETDLAGKFTFFNNQVVESHRRSREELSNLSHSDYMDEETAKKIVRVFRQVYLTGEMARDLTYEIIRHDGTKLYIDSSVALIKDAKGTPLGFRGISRNVTERKQVEETLRQSEERHRTIVEEMADSFWEMDLTGHFTFFNNQVMVEQKRTREELLALNNTNNRQHIDEENQQKAFQIFQQVYFTGKPLRGVTYEMIRGDGERYTIESSISLIRDAKGHPCGFRGISRDVTKRIQFEKELQRAKEAAEAANRAKSEFLANMSHEIRTPMNGIIGMTELALGTELSSEQREYLGLVKYSADALLELINDMLDFSKIEAGRLDLDSINFRLRDSLDDTMKTLALRAHQKGLELACQIQPEVPDTLLGDPGRLRQIIVNLVGNAIKFTEQGEVVVRVAVEKQNAENARLHFTVTDTGIGIPEEKQHVIFDAFSQADNSTTRRYGGTGLGLTISSRLVGLMNGQIWVESQPACGSTFHFTAHFGIPTDMPTATVTKPKIDWQHSRVLVVDDNATNRRILEEVLLHWQLKPVVVENAQAALLALQQASEAGQAFSLILLDAHMPEMDGFTLAKEIKSNTDLAGATIMMLSSGGQPGDAARCRELGIGAYLTKPVKQSELLNAMLSILDMATNSDSPTHFITRHSLRENRVRYHILLAEDNSVNQRLATRLLEKEGHSVVVAGNGCAALVAYEKETFDLILLDVQMPELNGYEVTAFIRAKERVTGAHIPIIAMTAHALKGDLEQCLAAGMDGYVAKPIKAQELIETIEKLALTRIINNQINTAASPERDVIDKQIALAQVSDDAELLVEIITLFLEDYPLLLEELQEAIANGDSQGLMQAAHSLKGAVGNFGAKSAYEAALKLEMIGQEGNLTMALEACHALTIEIDRMQVALTALSDEVKIGLASV